VIVGFRLKPGRDDALISWLDSLPEKDRSYHIRETLRANLRAPMPTAKVADKAECPPLPASNIDDIEAALDSWASV